MYLQTTAVYVYYIVIDYMPGLLPMNTISHSNILPNFYIGLVSNHYSSRFTDPWVQPTDVVIL